MTRVPNQRYTTTTTTCNDLILPTVWAQRDHDLRCLQWWWTIKSNPAEPHYMCCHDGIFKVLGGTSDKPPRTTPKSWNGMDFVTLNSIHYCWSLGNDVKTAKESQCKAGVSTTGPWRRNLMPPYDPSVEVSQERLTQNDHTIRHLQQWNNTTNYLYETAIKARLTWFLDHMKFDSKVHKLLWGRPVITTHSYEEPHLPNIERYEGENKEALNALTTSTVLTQYFMWTLQCTM